MQLIALSSYNGKNGCRIARGDTFSTDNAHAAELIANGIAKPDDSPKKFAPSHKSLDGAPENKQRGRKKGP